MLRENVDAAATTPSSFSTDPVAARIEEIKNICLKDARGLLDFPSYDRLLASLLTVARNDATPEKIKISLNNLPDHVISHSQCMKSIMPSVLKSTSELLYGEIEPKEYEIEAQKMRGHADLAWQIIGAAMFAVGLAVATAATIALAIATAPVPIAAVTLVTGLALAKAGHSFFSNASQQGLSLAASRLNSALKAEPIRSDKMAGACSSATLVI